MKYGLKFLPVIIVRAVRLLFGKILYLTLNGDKMRFKAVVPLMLLIISCPLLRQSALASDIPGLIPDRKWDVLKPASYAGMLRQASAEIGEFRFFFAENWIDGARLRRFADRCENDIPVRALREALNKPVDGEDFLYFLDDLIAQKKLSGVVWVTSSRARNAGILLHPDDVFFNKPRVYGSEPRTIPLDKPMTFDGVVPAKDGAYLGAGWAKRYMDPVSEKSHYAAFRRTEKGTRFAARIRSLVRQLRAQGAIVSINSSVRNRRRGYLMWACFELSRAENEKQLKAIVKKLERINTEHELNVPIKWQYEGDWKKTAEAAREMAEVYDVVYATEKGALNSSHYGGDAVDFSATGLPRKLTLHAPDGAVQTFNLENPSQARDLSLSPELIGWVEAHFKMKKLLSDYPHWDNTGE